MDRRSQSTKRTEQLLSAGNLNTGYGMTKINFVYFGQRRTKLSQPAFSLTSLWEVKGP